MIKTTEKLKEKIERGFILLKKNDKLDLVKLPNYGEVVIKVQDNKIVHIATTHHERCS